MEKISDAEFFREATLRICRTLDIGQAVSGLYDFLGRYLPLDAVVLLFMDSGLNEVRNLVTVDENGAHVSARKFSLDDKRFSESSHKGPSEEPLIDHYPVLAEDPLMTELARLYCKGMRSAAVCHLSLDRIGVAGALFFSREERSFTGEHLRLLAALNDPLAVAVVNALRFAELEQRRRQLAEQNVFLNRELAGRHATTIVGAETGLRRTMGLVRQVARRNSPVLLFGETGAGKEVVAGELHGLSDRRDGPFITVNCGAIPATLVDSELFGSEKGAFTGAVARTKGRFERAHGGTIFLDEVGELPLDAQVRLLRVLQEREVERLGGSSPIKVDIRVIAATHRNLEEMMARGTFRQDLFYRLNVVPITIPPLRDRKEDLPALVDHFLKSRAEQLGVPRADVSSLGMRRVMAYDWPGNIRELENLIERNLILASGAPLDFDELAPSARYGDGAVGEDSASLDEAMRRHIRKVLEACGGRVEGVSGAARVLQVNPSTLRNRMRKLGIPFGRETLVYKGDWP